MYVHGVCVCVLLLLKWGIFKALSHWKWMRKNNIYYLYKKRFKNFQIHKYMWAYFHTHQMLRIFKWPGEVFQKTIIQTSVWILKTHQIWVLILAPCLRFKWWGEGKEMGLSGVPVRGTEISLCTSNLFFHTPRHRVITPTSACFHIFFP